jgi:hypothetical protein
LSDESCSRLADRLDLIAAWLSVAADLLAAIAVTIVFCNADRDKSDREPQSPSSSYLMDVHPVPSGRRS